jgi:cytochrome c
MRGFAAGLGLVAIAMIALQLSTVRAQDNAARPEFYSSKVFPILQQNCGTCHLGTNHRGGLNFQTRESLLKGGRDGKVVVPGDPANSLLIKLIRHENPSSDPGPMPPRRPKLSDSDIATITAWIKSGAVMPPTK